MHRITMTQPLRGFTPDQLPVLQALLDQIVKAIGENPYDAFEDIVVTTPAPPVPPNTTFAVALSTLGRTPTGYQVLAKDRACDLYTAPAAVATQWKKNLIYLRCTVASAKLTLRVT